jgi:hypothetical protein
MALCSNGLALGEYEKGEPEAVRCVLRKGDCVPGLKPRVCREVDRGEEA